MKKLLVTLMIISVSGCDSSSSSSSSGISASEAHSKCASTMQSKVNRGGYTGSDSSQMREMENDLSSCMGKYGHY